MQTTSSHSSVTRRAHKSGLWMLLVAMLSGVYSLGHAAAPRVMPSDLAIILPADPNLRISAADFVAPLREPLLPRDLLGQVEEAYTKTSVGDALRTENTYAEWTLVSVRIAPCSPLGSLPGPETQVLCWPEVRLVWQPVLKDFRRYAVILTAFADDRAIHSLYDFAPEQALNPQQASRAQSLLNVIRQNLEKSPQRVGAGLSKEDLSEFLKLRDLASHTLMQKTLSLRGGSLPDASYSSFAERPEFNSPDVGPQFLGRLKKLLSELAPRASLKEMTSFSLPEGREPPQSDEWIFLQFLRKNGSMEQESIKLRSAKDGRVLFDFGYSTKASQMRDDPALHDALTSMNATDASEVKQRVLLSPAELSTKKNLINDRNLTLVPNTSCASCHKLNSLRFDFHALSYLEDRTISVSPRVKTDVARDLEWLEKNGLSTPRP